MPRSVRHTALGDLGHTRPGGRSGGIREGKRQPCSLECKSLPAEARSPCERARPAASASFANLLPGESKTIPIQLENDGDFDLNLSAQLTATTGSGYAIRLKMDDACTTSGFLSSPYLTDPALVAATPAGIGSIGDGTTKQLCVQVTADSGMIPSSAMTFDVTISGDSGS